MYQNCPSTISSLKFYFTYSFTSSSLNYVSLLQSMINKSLKKIFDGFLIYCITQQLMIISTYVYCMYINNVTVIKNFLWHKLFPSVSDGMLVFTYNALPHIKHLNGSIDHREHHLEYGLGKGNLDGKTTTTTTTTSTNQSSNPLQNNLEA